MTKERAFEIAFEVVTFLSNKEFTVEDCMEVADLAANIERAAFFQRMYPLEHWYNILKDEAVATDDEKRLLAINGILDMLDEWEEEIA